MPLDLGQHVLRDLDVESLADAIAPLTQRGRQLLIERLGTSSSDIEAEQERIRTTRSHLNETVLAARKILQETEEDVASVAAAAEDSRHAEYYNQILWGPKTILAPLNEHGWVTEAMIFFRTLFLPGLAFFLPIFVFLAPFIFYVFILKKPISFSEYFEMLSVSLKKAMPSVLGKPRFTGRGGALEVGEQFIHIGISAAVFIASTWNQVSAAISMRKAVTDMRRRAAAVLRMESAIVSLQGALGLAAETERGSWARSDLGAFGQAWNTPTRVLKMLTVAGELDVTIALALQKRTCFVEFGDISAGIVIEKLWHPGTSTSQGTERRKPVYNSIQMGVTGKRAQVLLTGPNRGGKSTVLKSMGAAVLMAHSLGIVFAKKAQMPRFGTIITALAPTDTIGKLSLFEAEIEFAKDVKERLAIPTGGPMFLMMDEIFHGTNAHDGVAASQVFLDELYRTAPLTLFSMVSTHYMDLPSRYGEKLTQNLCMDTKQDPTDPDRLIYSYRLKTGVNQFSSVREILRERGLLTEKSSVPACKE